MRRPGLFISIKSRYHKAKDNMLCIYPLCVQFLCDLLKYGTWTEGSGFYSVTKRYFTQGTLTHVVAETTLSYNCLFRLFWWTPTVQWRQGPTPHRGRTTRVKTWIQNMTIMINRTPAMQVNPTEDLFCCTKKSNTKEKKQQWNKTAKIFPCECPAFSLHCSVSS